MKTRLHRPYGEAGFTLLELLAAVVILSMLTAAVSSVLIGAFQARDRVGRVLDESLERSVVMRAFQRDLEHMTVPNGLMAGPILGEMIEEMDDARADTLEFYSASGRLREDEPWGDIRKIAYTLAEPEELDPPSATKGWVLLRTVTDNLLPSTEEETVGEPILEGVSSLSFSYYDGESWQDSWDSTALDDEPPQVVHVRIERLGADAPLPPIELMCPIVVRKAPEESGASEKPQ